ncbi:MAG: Ig-like domain-containing protein [Syntrophomonas sp.]
MSKKIIGIIMSAFIMIMLSGLPAAADKDGGINDVLQANPRLCNPQNVTYYLGIPVEGWAHYYGSEVKIELDDREKLLQSRDWKPWSDRKYYAYTGYADGKHVIYAMFRDFENKQSSIYWNLVFFDSTPPACGGIYQLNQNDVSITSTDQDYKISTITVKTGIQADNAQRVWMFTWTEKNGQDDMKFCECTYDGTVVPNNNEKIKWIGNVSLSDHNNEDGKYITHIFTQDHVGNMAFMGQVEMIVDKTPPDAAIITTPTQAINADTINIEGTAEAGAKVNVSGGTSPATGTVGADGKFSVNTGLKQDQVNNISVIVEDGAGHQSGSSNVVTITEDSMPPTISSISASATFTTETSFEVNAVAVDSGSGIAKVVFPTWTASNDQDDLIWHEGIRGASGKFYYNVNKTDHNNEAGQYLTDVYAYDNAGNCAGKARLTVNVQTPPPAKPTLTTASQFINADTINIEGTAEAGKKVTVSGGTSPAAGISGADGTFSVNIGLNQDQENIISVYAEDDKGNKSDPANLTITEDSTPPVISSIFTISAGWDRGLLSLYTRHDVVAGGAFITDNFGIQSVKFPTWSAKNWQDDLIWLDGQIESPASVEQLPGDTGEFWFFIKDLREDPGKEDQFFTDVYAYDKAGNYTCKSRLSTTNDTIRPAAPTLITEAQTTNADTIYIEGSAEAGSTVLIERNYDGNPFSSDRPTGSDGIFRVNVSLYHNKVNNLRVVACDAAGNGSPESIVAITHTDDPILTAAITTSVGNSTNMSPIPVTITFSKAVTGFELNDIVVTNGTKADFGGSGTTYTVNITPDANGLVTVAVPANAAIDAENHGNIAAPSLSIYYDNTQPTVTLEKSQTAAASDSSFIPVNITFSEAVSGFELNDIAVTNGTAADFTGSGTTYAVVIKPAMNGVVTIGVPADTARDESGNGNSAASTLSITCATIKPTVSIAAGSSNVSPVAATFTFSEAVTGFELNDISVTNGTAENLQGSGTTYTADIKPAAQGLVSIDVAAGAAIDTVGNGNQAAPCANITYDTTNPTVNISSAIVANISNPSNRTNLSSIPVTITFSEAVTGFDSGDVTVANGTIAEFSGSGTTYTMGVKPNADGIVTIDVAAGAVSDESGNGNTPAAQLSLTYDGSKPVVSISAGVTKTNNNTSIPVTITFSEAVTGFELNDISVGNGTPADFDGSGTTYTLNVTPAAEGLITVNVPANTASDATGNNNTSSALLSISYDTTKPAVKIHCNTNTVSSANVTSIPVNIMFNKAVTGFTQEDINVTNGTIYNMTGSGSNYIADIKTLGQTAINVNVAADIAQDEYGNSNTGAALDISNVEIPTLTAEPNDITLAAGENATLSVAASVSQGNLTYQWYSSTTSSNSDGSAIDGATGSTYSAPASAAGTFYYYCAVTNTDNTATAYTTAVINSKAATVTVNAPYAPPPWYSVTGVTLDKNSLSLQVNGSPVKLTAAVEPSYASNPYCTWSSSDSSVASVDNSGLVTPVSPGQANIIVTTNDGGKTASCLVTVIKPEVAGSGEPITITDTPTTITVPEGTTGASLDVTPGAALPQVEINASSDMGNIQIQIPAGSTASGSENWDGNFSLPVVSGQASININGASQVNTVVTIGLDDEKISFSKAVRILIPGQAGKHVGYVRNGQFTEITRTISADQQAVADSEIPTDGEGKIDAGSDLVVWTKHFTEFVVYTSVNDPNPASYTVSLAANYDQAGTVSGGGTFVSGSFVTVTARPASGYEFESWTEGGGTISQDASYSFNLGNQDRSLIANFLQVFPDKLNQAADKPWTVAFSQAISLDDNNRSNIYVATDAYGENRIEGIKIEAVPANSRQLVIKPPASNWTSGQTYYLIIEPDFQSQAGDRLKTKIRMKFTII